MSDYASGSQFPINALPRWLLPISLALPLTYGFDAARGFLLRAPTLIPIRYEIGVLIVFMFIMVFLGIASFKRLEKRARVLGTLGQH